MEDIFMKAARSVESPHLRTLSKTFSDTTKNAYYLEYENLAITQKELVKALEIVNRTASSTEGDYDDFYAYYSVFYVKTPNPEGPWMLIGKQSAEKEKDESYRRYYNLAGGTVQIETLARVILKELDLNLAYLCYSQRLSLLSINPKYAQEKTIDLHLKYLDQFGHDSDALYSYLVAQIWVLGMRTAPIENSIHETNSLMLQMLEDWLDSL